MTSKSHMRGHEIEWNGRAWVYCDTKEPTAYFFESRPCGYCGRSYTKEGHDGCLGTLPGVMNACCGHGVTKEAYVQFLDGKGIYGENAIKIMGLLKYSDAQGGCEE